MIIMNGDRNFWTEFIALYHALPSLWRRGGKEYADKDLKAQQYEQLVAKLRERYPKADRQTVIRKINGFRSNYRREKRMVEIHRHAGKRSSPTLWYFHQLSFLDESLHWKGCQKIYEEEDEEASEDQDIYSPRQKQLNYADDIELYDEMLMDSDSDSEESCLENNHIFWREFFEIYKGLPSLWCTSSASFRDRQRKSRDYKVLVDKLREVYPRSASKDLAKRKINNFRSAFRREHRKVLAAKSSMLTYVPKLWYYNLLLFLSDHLEGSDDLEAEDEVSQQGCCANGDSDEAGRSPEFKGFQNGKPTESLASTSSQKSNNSSPLEDSIALSWSAQYKEMDRYQKILARKLIGDILFHGCLGNLNVELTKAVHNVLTNLKG